MSVEQNITTLQKYLCPSMQQQEGSDTSGTVAGTGQVAKQMSWEPDTDQYFPEMANMVLRVWSHFMILVG